MTVPAARSSVHPLLAVAERLSLLALDHELADAVPDVDRRQAESLLTVDAVRLPAGPWEPSLLRADGVAGSGLLVVSGMLTREVHLLDRQSAQLLGPGDVLRPFDGSSALVPHETAWRVLEDTVCALLDERFTFAARRWPGLFTILQNRLFDHAERVTVQLAIAQLPRVEQRVLAMLWHLAERWGTMTADGVVVRLALTHEALGRLVGARRPTVSLALAELAASGTVVRRPDGTWLLERSSGRQLA